MRTKRTRRRSRGRIRRTRKKIRSARGIGAPGSGDGQEV